MSTLGDYLRVRRAMVSLEEVGLPHTTRRRVPGLRREEVAELVGLSTDYYVRIEQGRAARPSDEVLEALSRALRLGPAERAYLFDLARPPRRVAEQPHPDLSRVIGAIPLAPAVIMNDRTDVLAWNRLAAALLADFPRLPRRERNMARRIFLDPDARDVHPDWDDAARTTVGMLRLAAGRRPRDAGLARLVGDLSLGSEHFRQLWASHHVHEKTRGPKRFRHPDVGELALQYDTFHAPGTSPQLLVIYTASPGTPAAEALALLGSLVAA